MENVNQYVTRDLGEAAALTASGQILIEIKSEGTRHSLFVFIDKKSSEKIARGFWANTLQLPARDYHSALKLLKSRLYSQGNAR